MLLFFGGMVTAVRNLRRQDRFRRGQKTEVRGQVRSAEAASQRFSVSEFTQEWSWRRRLVLPMAVIALLGVALHALIDFPLQIESIQLYAAVYLGLCWGSARWNSAR